jgi:enamine deaminase RidA (YjgF/YER057c/UK114 family)
LDDLVEVTCMLADRAYIDDYVASRKDAFTDAHPPATTTIFTQQGRDELLVEIKAIAVIGSWRK